MKNLIYLLLVLPYFGISQSCDLPEVDGKFEIQEVVYVKEATKTEIFNAAIIALAELLKSKEEFIELRSLEEGVVLAKFTTHTHHDGVFMIKDNFFQFLLRFELRTARYRTTVNYLNHESAVNGEYHCACLKDFLADKCGAMQCLSKGEWKKQKCKAIEKVELFLRDLEKHINENLSDKNW